jgi:uncharacterized protein (AIM24 family)
MANTKLTKIVVDCSTGEQTEVELTAEEIAQREADALAYAEAQATAEAEAQAVAAAKASAETKLAELGLTAEEIAALKA